MSVSETRRQRLNLSELHAECGLNYMRLLRLLPKPIEESSSVAVDFADGPGSGMRATVLEVTKYTCLLSIVTGGSRPDWLPGIEVKVRIYHDARMAEVVEWCSDRTIPWLLCENSGKQARDERWQWNRFLSELLAHSFSRGMSMIKV